MFKVMDIRFMIADLDLLYVILRHRKVIKLFAFNNKAADQPAHLPSLISTKVIHCLVSSI